VQKYPPLFKGFRDLPIYEKGKIGWNYYQKVIFWLAVSNEYANCPPEAQRPFFDFDSDQKRLLYYKSVCVSASIFYVSYFCLS
jgi:hypothetical protein